MKIPIKRDTAFRKKSHMEGSHKNAYYKNQRVVDILDRKSILGGELGRYSSTDGWMIVFQF